MSEIKTTKKRERERRGVEGDARIIIVQ